MTAKRKRGFIYWFIRQIGQSTYGVRRVCGNSLPQGEEEIITAKELFAQYEPEIERFEQVMLPAVSRSDFRIKADDFSGFGYTRSNVRMDEANVRALFELILQYQKSGMNQSARRAVNELLQVENPFRGKNQFLFNDFGISLRKAGEFRAAVTSYRKALKYTRDDDHLYYNLARAHYEQGQWWDCIQALGKCFEHNPELTVSRWLVELILALSKDHALLIRYNKPPVPEGVARRANLLAEAVEFTRTEKMPATLPQAERRRVWHGPGHAEKDDVDALIDRIDGLMAEISDSAST